MHTITPQQATARKEEAGIEQQREEGSKDVFYRKARKEEAGIEPQRKKGRKELIS